MRNEPEDNKEQESEHPMSYGGYSARQTYEKNQRRWQTPLLAALFVLLFLLSTVGLIALFRGTFFTVGDDGQGTAGKVTVPVVNNNKFETPESAVAAAEEALITVEVKGEEKTLRGTGFVLSREGWAVCSSTLFEEDNAATATVYLDDGSVTEGTLAGSIPSLGIAVLQLPVDHNYHSITLGNSNFIRRGQTLYGVAAVQRSVFNGLAQSGTAVSTAENVAVTVRGEYRSIPVLYTSILYDETLEGALIITEEGNAAGFLTGSLEGRGGGMTAIPIITLVGLVNEIINAN